MESPKLKVLSGKMKGTVYELTDEMYLCGRRPTCDIHLDDKSISSSHCCFIRTEDGKYKVIDDSSTNGTRVNNIPIKEKVLYFGDVIQIGNAEVIYSCEDIDPTPKTIPMVNININDSDTNIISDMTNMTPYPEKKKRWHSKLFIFTLTILFVTVITLLGVLVMMMFK